MTFAVTGFGDDECIGQHSESDGYWLEVELDAVSHIDDYNDNGIVNTAHYTVCRAPNVQSIC